MGENMKKRIFAVLLCLLLFLSFSTTAEAKARIDVIQNGGFIELSDEDMEGTIVALIALIAKDCGNSETPLHSVYDWPESHALAYNTLWSNRICVNLSGFRTTDDADAAGVSVEYHLVKTLAHEVRHSYQWEHRYDDSDYGRACYQGFEDYQSYDGDRESYYAQFIEADAEEYAIAFADNYFK